jgi:hypothetical protein
MLHGRPLNSCCCCKTTDRIVDQCTTYRKVCKAGHVLLQHAPLEGRRGRLAIVLQRDCINCHHKLVLEVDLSSHRRDVTVVTMLAPTLAMHCPLDATD